MTKTTPRNVRNNNPLNIRYNHRNNWLGKVHEPCKQDAHYEEFSDLKYGFRAAFLLAHKYMTNYNCKTLWDFLQRWAPASDGNNTTVYAQTVARALNRTIPSIYAPLPPITWSNTWLRIAVAMAHVEGWPRGYNEELYLAAVEGIQLACKSLRTRPVLDSHYYETHLHDVFDGI